MHFVSTETWNMKDNTYWTAQSNFLYIYFILEILDVYGKIDSTDKDWRSHIKLWRWLGIDKYTVSKIDKYYEKQELAKCVK